MPIENMAAINEEIQEQKRFKETCSETKIQVRFV